MLNLPASTLVDRKIPKVKFYEKLEATTQLKEAFVHQVDSITWKHKLSKETIGLEPRDTIEEIQTFEIQLRVKHYSTELLQAIDRAIPYPVLFVLLCENEAKLAMAYKERSQTDDNRAVIRSYHETEWQRAEDIRFEPLQGLDLKAVYENVIRSLLPAVHKPDIPLEVVLERQAHTNRLTQECNRLEARIRREKQFNRKVELNLELQRKRRELANLERE